MFQEKIEYSPEFVKSFSASCRIFYENGHSILDFSDEIQKNILGYNFPFLKSVYTSFLEVYGTPVENNIETSFPFLELINFISTKKELNPFFYKDFEKLSIDISKKEEKEVILIYDKHKEDYQKIYKNNVRYLSESEMNFFDLTKIKYIIIETSTNLKKLIDLLLKMNEKFNTKCFYEETFSGHYKNQRMFLSEKLILPDLDGIISYNNFLAGIDHFCLYSKSKIGSENRIFLSSFESFLYLNFLNFTKKNNEIKIKFEEKINLFEKKLKEILNKISTVVSKIEKINNSIHIKFNDFIEAEEFIEIAKKNGLKFSNSSIFENGISININLNLKEEEINEAIEIVETTLIQLITINS